MKDETHKEFLHAYDQNADAIYRHCFFRLFSRERAEDAVQETFIKAWQYLQAGKEVLHMRAFLYRIATNTVIDMVRKKSEESLDRLLEDGILEPASRDHEHIQSRVLGRQLLEVLQELPEPYREAVTLRYVDDLDPKEIAEILDISANNVSVRINRGLAMLRERQS